MRDLPTDKPEFKQLTASSRGATSERQTIPVTTYKLQRLHHNTTMIVPKPSTEATTATTMDMTPQRRPFQRLHMNSTAKKQVSPINKHPFGPVSNLCIFRPRLFRRP